MSPKKTMGLFCKQNLAKPVLCLKHGYVIAYTQNYSGGFLHYNDMIISATTSQITCVKTVYLIVCSGADQRQHQSSASLAFVLGIHRWPVNSPHKGPVTRKMFPFDDVIMRPGHVVKGNRIQTSLKRRYAVIMSNKKYGMWLFTQHFETKWYLRSYLNAKRWKSNLFEMRAWSNFHDDVIDRKHSEALDICGGIHRSPVDSPHKGQWHGALMVSLIFA